MDTSEDLYSILGVLPSADTEIIKAVFRTLAKRYHPDRFSDPAAADQGKEHFIKIQKAYEILINPETRAQYDREYNEERGDRGEFRADAGPDEARDDNSEDFGDAELAADWATAIEYFPEVEKIRKELARLSRDLSVLFQLALIERKSFASSEAKSIAQALESEYLDRFFGKNSEIRQSAVSWLLNGHAGAAKELNRLVRIAGSDSAAEALPRLRKKYNIRSGGERRSTTAKTEDGGGWSASLRWLFVITFVPLTLVFLSFLFQAY